ncbi:alpha/beta hydrolase fold domain-containing protein [Reyranella sp. CPCC 100927]|uniref:alpha/beta hydrolase family protein n=1 Tax=Reyranella sp. CPCC 100927 TaxID=2599616 RepID=UPI0011B489D8|nr:alpha/beta hydrolase fold domain-containing protein [Reyranella sp. CPCC 100927]TWT09657.1 dienelactone hydrolase [Reyranella sp. CPCC 100927]
MHRSIRAIIIFATVWLLTAVANAQPFHAGISRLSADSDGTPFDVLVWYPTPAAETPWHEGIFAIPASRDAALAPGIFPIILLSHGGGLRGGSPLTLRTLSASLARQGYIVVAPFHGTTARSFVNRPRQIAAALNAVLAAPRMAGHADPTRLGMLGFSLGGAVTLVLAGGAVNVGHMAAYCGAHPEDTLACTRPGGNDGGVREAPPSGIIASLTRLPLKAIVLLDPLAVPFDRAGLADVTMPTLLYRPQDSLLRADGNALALAAALSHPPRLEMTPGGHFVFLDTCPPEARSQEAWCDDPPGVDRASLQVRIGMEIATFFRDHL